ncbi:MAG: Tn7-like transposition protein [Bacillales bacterium]|jgi:hypothetical protein|nr:Tn7-like transposition protein [Bacillales bacterium]
MSKRQRGWTEDKIAKYYKEGRGSGDLSNYKPWLTVQDVPSQGRTHRPKGWKTGRIHQLLSDLEYKYFCLLEWSDDIIDIREQFPLNREHTIAIAESKNIKHSVDLKTRTPIVMTTDFLITIRKNNDLIHIARTVKHSKELEGDDVIDKFEIERAYWENQGVNWGIVTENGLNSQAIDNIKWLHNSFFEEDLYDYDVHCNLLHELSIKGRSIINTLNEFDGVYKLEKGTSLSTFKWMLAKKIINIDINIIFDIKNNTDTLLIKDISISEKRWAT